MISYKIIETINNAIIVEDNKRQYGIVSPSGSIIVYPKWDDYRLIALDPTKRNIIIKQDGKFGLYDTVALDYIAYCTISNIIRIDPKRKVLIGKERRFLWNRIPLWNWTIEIPLK